MQRVETVINLFWLLLGVAVCAYAVQLGLTGSFGPGSGLFPMLAGIALAASGACLLALKGHRIPEATTFWEEEGAAGRVFPLLAILVALLIALPWLGFVISGLLATPLMLRTVERVPWWFAILIGWSATCIIYVLFALILKTQLPSGVLGF